MPLTPSIAFYSIRINHSGAEQFPSKQWPTILSSTSNGKQRFSFLSTQNVSNSNGAWSNLIIFAMSMLSTRHETHCHWRAPGERELERVSSILQCKLYKTASKEKWNYALGDFHRIHNTSKHRCDWGRSRDAWDGKGRMSQWKLENFGKIWVSMAKTLLVWLCHWGYVMVQDAARTAPAVVIHFIIYALYTFICIRLFTD